MISFENVSKFILSDVTTYIPEGKIVGLIGMSGAGKTTFLNLASGLLSPEKGAVHTIGCNPIRYRKQLTKEMRVYFSDVPFFQRERTVSDEFSLTESVYRLESNEFAKQSDMLKELFSICDIQTKTIGELSLGQRRRVELSSLLLGNAKLMILDEPTNGLDEQGKVIFWEQLQQKKKQGSSILISSHNMREMETLCDRILLLDGGRLIYYGDQQQLLRKYTPVNKMKIRFEGAIPDMNDLPLIKYSIENNILRLQYNSNVISAAEITEQIIGQTTVVKMEMIEPELSDVILRRKEEVSYESFH